MGPFPRGQALTISEEIPHRRHHPPLRCENLDVSNERPPCYHTHNESWGRITLKKKQLNGEKRPSHVKLQLAFFSSCFFRSCGLASKQPRTGGRISDSSSRCNHSFGFWVGAFFLPKRPTAVTQRPEIGCCREDKGGILGEIVSQEATPRPPQEV